VHERISHFTTFAGNAIAAELAAAPPALLYGISTGPSITLE
jgi:hypothetical protein